MPELSNSVETIQVSLELNGEPVELTLKVPAGPASNRVVLPLLQFLTNTVVDLAEKQANAEGKCISCQKGCGACCRQLVPISQIESHHLAALIHTFDPARQASIEARFSRAKQQLSDAGMLTELQSAENIPASQLNEVGLRYFRLGIACPFLEEESCSIHQQRPLACREYLVTSPAQRCEDPTEDSIQRVELPGQPSRLLLDMGVTTSPEKRKWVPLILALYWAAENPEQPWTRTGPEIVEDLIAKLGG